MLGRFSSALQNAMDALAPPAPLYDDFVYHWKRLMKHYLDIAATNKVPIELTNIPAHLDQLQKILLKEDNECQGNGTTGSCLEYLLRHNLLDLLATLATSDDPPGMRQYVLHFVSKIITQLQAPIVAHNSVFPSLQRLINICDGNHPTASEMDEVKFLFSVAALIRKHPHLIYVFMLKNEANNESTDRRSSVSSEASSQLSSTSNLMCGTPPLNNPLFRPLVSPVMSPEPKIIPISNQGEVKHTFETCDITEPMSKDIDTNEENTHFPLLDALLSYINSADCSVKVKVCQGIMLLASLPDDKFASSQTKRSHMFDQLTSKLNSLYLDIPASTDPSHIEDMHVSWGHDVPLSAEVEVNCDGCRQAATFLSWFDFCDQVISESRASIGEALAFSIRESFLEQQFKPENLTNVLVIAIVSKCYRMVTSHSLQRVMSEWLVGEAREPELPGVMMCRTRHALLESCSDQDPAVCLEALRLYEGILEKNKEHDIHCVAVTYVVGRRYYDSTVSLNQIESWSDEEDERERHRDSPVTDSPTTSSVSRTLAPTHIDKIIHSFLSVIPMQIRSSPVTDATGYHQYITESQRQYSLIVATCSSFSWPSEATSDDNLSSDSHPESDYKQFYEGPFLRMIFKKIRDLPNQAYEVNLQLTAVISRLALLPHPYLHEYLLNTVLPRRPEADSLLQALQDTAAELLTRVTSVPNYKSLLTTTRHRLLGDMPDHRDELNNLLGSVVVLEELCKELAAIAYVKFNYAT